MSKSLNEAVKFFANPINCDRFMISVRWPDGQIRCPVCNSERVGYLARLRQWKCYAKRAHPRAKFTLKRGTIFEDSPLPLEKWMMAIWLIANCKNGISSCELARHLDITQKAAWHMDHRIRAAMRVASLERLAGDCEMDETFIGGKARNMRVSKKLRRITGTGRKDKVSETVILKRGGQVRTTIMPKRKRYPLQAEVRKHVEVGSVLYSDALNSYEGLANEYSHQIIDHAIAYVDGKVHTNALENFWSLMKRSISGTRVSVEPFHLFHYLDKQSFRYDHRKPKNSERFQIVAEHVIGRRLTYSELTGKSATA